MIRVTGPVIKGKGEARTLGFPTANIDYTSTEVAEGGVWTCFVEYEGKKLEGLAVVDMWKQPNGLPSIETHILDFNRDLYGQTITATLVSKIRSLQKFASLADLAIKIKEDIVIARKEFAQLSN